MDEVWASQLPPYRQGQCPRDVAGPERRNLSPHDHYYMREKWTLSFVLLHSWSCYNSSAYILVNTDGRDENRKQTWEIQFGIVLSGFFSLEAFHLYISVKVYLSNCLTKSLEINSFIWTSFLLWFPFYFICITYSCNNFVSWYFHVLSIFFVAVEFLHLYSYCCYRTLGFYHTCITVGCYGMNCVPPIHMLKP